MTSPTPVARISDMAGVLACVPSILGFQPERSLVVLLLLEGRVNLTMRVSLDEANLNQLTEATVQAARRAGCHQLLVVGYAPRVTPGLQAMLGDLAVAVENESMDDPQPLSVLGLAAIGRDGWCELAAWSTAIPPLRPLFEIDEHTVRVEQIFQGKAVAGSRQEVAKRVKPDSEPRPAAFEVAAEASITALPMLTPDEVMRLVNEDLDAIEAGSVNDPVDASTLGRIVAMLSHPDARDAAMLRISPDTARRYVEVWSQLVRWTGGRACLAALFLAGTAGWVSGDGALVNMCVDEARQVDPEHVGVQLLTAVTQHALPPELFDRIKADVQPPGRDAQAS